MVSAADTDKNKETLYDVPERMFLRTPFPRRITSRTFMKMRISLYVFTAYDIYEFHASAIKSQFDFYRFIQQSI